MPIQHNKPPIFYPDHSDVVWARWFEEVYNYQKFYGFRVHRNGTNQLGILTGINTKVAFTTAEYDTSGAFDVTTNYRFTPTRAGYYEFYFQARWAVAMGAGENRISRIYKNGAEIASGIESSPDTTSVTIPVTTITYLNGSTDYVEFFVSQNSGVNKDLFGGQLQTFATGKFIGF